VTAVEPIFLTTYATIVCCEAEYVEAFATVRDKFIDVELRPGFSPEEAYDIAAVGRDIPYEGQTRNYFVALAQKTSGSHRVC
jgi:hypothetical protein